MDCVEEYLALCSKFQLLLKWLKKKKNRELSLVPCDNTEESDGGGSYVYLWLIDIVLQQKPTQHCKAIILLFKKNYY